MTQTQTNTTFTCAACGDTFTMPRDGSCGTGYALERGIDANGAHERKYCYPCAAGFDRAQAHATGELFAYVHGVRIFHVYTLCPERATNQPYIATWPGVKLADINVGGAWRSNFGDVRVSIWFNLDGEQWSGIFYASAGDYARCKRNKVQAAQTTGGNT